MGSYVPTTAAEREEMLAAIGVDSLEGLYKAVPQEMLLRSGGTDLGLIGRVGGDEFLAVHDGLDRREEYEAFTKEEH